MRIEKETADLSTPLRSGNCQFSNGRTPVHGSTNLSSRPERTRISCRAALDMATCAAFFKESRMKIANTTKLNRKSGVAEWRDLRFLLPTHFLSY